MNCNAFLFPRQIEIPDFIVGRRPVPHSPLSIAEEFAYCWLGMRKWIIDYVPSLWIESSNQAHVVRVIPKIPIGIKTQTVRARIRTRQGKFLEGLRLRVEPRHFPAAI